MLLHDNSVRVAGYDETALFVERAIGLAMIRHELKMNAREIRTPRRQSNLGRHTFRIVRVATILSTLKLTRQETNRPRLGRTAREPRQRHAG